MSSSEDDYMSDTFLMGCVKDDIRPGLIHTHADKRNHELLKRKGEKNEINKLNNRPKSFIEAENRENALNQPISSDNKGFAMLQKLGYKPGTGLGKSNAGRTEPVPLNFKTDRQGLGRMEALKEIAKKKANIKKEIQNKITNIDNYRTHLAEKAAEKKAAIDLRKSQRICKQFDTDSGLLEPDEVWFWLDYEQKETDDDDNEDDNWSSSEKKNKQMNNCDKDEEGEEEEEEEEYEEYTVKEKLEMLTYYLRQTYCYCIWCGIQYDDDRDLGRECPGPTYEDH
ncbi:G patch domain-containing protein 11 [Lycorma delicatula]|uniref:G patch domain-containing protein 11 n=1 Tax=Lycorma delicatula TaxID=130591 RepID=UPI003F50EC56